MTAHNVANLEYGSLAKGLAKAAPIEAPVAEVQRFSETFDRVAQAGTTAPVVAQAPVAAQQPTAIQPPAQAVDPVTSAEAQERARRTLGLEPGATPTAVTGDKILDSLQGMRQVFDVQKAAITKFAANPNLNGINLVSMQLEVTKYTLLVDVTSKLAGKSTQAFDSLLKSQ